MPRPGPLLGALLLCLASPACGLPIIRPEYPKVIPPRILSTKGKLKEVGDDYPWGYIDYAKHPPGPLVQLWCYDSFFVPTLAVHPYFLIFDPTTERWERWEIWAGDQFGNYVEERTSNVQYSDERGTVEVTKQQRQFGAVRNWRPLATVDLRDDHLLGEWDGEDAEALIAVIKDPESYPRRDGYHIWPGPNSNSYPRWVLSQAGLGVDMDPRMVGKDWYGPLGFGLGLSPTRTGLHVDVLSFGATVGLADGVEVHFLGGTLGVDLWPPALKTPWGRLGFQE